MAARQLGVEVEPMAQAGPLPLTNPEATRWGASVRTILLALVACLPPLTVWPPDGFDGYFALKAYVVIALGLLLATWLAAAVRRFGGLPCRVGLLGWLCLALAVWLTLGSVLSASPETGVWGFPGRDDGLLVWLSGLVIMASAAQTRGWRDQRVIYGAILAAGCVLSIYGILQHFGLDLSGLAILRQTGRVFSSFRNPIFFGGYLALIIPLLLCAATYTRRGVRWAAIVGLATALAALYFTFTRAAWLGTAGGSVLFLVLVWRVGGGRQVIRLLGGLLSAGVIAACIAALPTASVSEQQHDVQTDLSTLTAVSNSRNDGRLAIWEISLRMISDHPLVGVGLDQMGSVFEDYRTERFNAAEGTERIADRAHSDPMHLAVVAGVPAAVLYLLIVVLVVGGSLLRCVRRTDAPGVAWHCAAVAAACAYMAQSLVSITVPGVHSLFFLVLGGLVAWQKGGPVGRIGPRLQ